MNRAVKLSLRVFRNLGRNTRTSTCHVSGGHCNTMTMMNQTHHSYRYYTSASKSTFTLTPLSSFWNGPALVTPKKSNRLMSTAAKDPTARRPNKVCDPYGQNGMPLSKLDASNSLCILDEGWALVIPEHEDAINHGAAEHPHPRTFTPTAISKEFYHANYIDASRFISIVSAVGHNNNHYPEINLERRLMKREKAWRVVTTVKCRTETLDGLSSHDFHIAMLVDVEVGREDTQRLLLDDKDSMKKHI